MHAAPRFAALCATLLLLACGTAQAAANCSATPTMTPLQKRLAARAADGPDALRRFVVMRQPIYQFAVAETMDQATRQQAWFAACGGLLSQAHATMANDEKAGD